MKWDIHVFDPKTQTTTTHVKDYPGTSASMAEAPAVVAKASRDFKAAMKYILAVPHREAKQPLRRDGRRQHATKKAPGQYAVKKTPAQLDREIAAAMAPSRAGATKKQYHLTPSSPKKLFRFTKAELEGMPTLSQGHFENLKAEGEVDGIPTRWWLTRMTVEDGEKHAVHVEQLIDGSWQVVHKYARADSSRTRAHASMKTETKDLERADPEAKKLVRAAHKAHQGPWRTESRPDDHPEALGKQGCCERQEDLALLPR